MIERLGKEDVRAMLRAHHFGRLGCCRENEPYVIPINYFYNGEDIYMHGLPGSKIQMMRENPQICLQVDEIKDDYNWRSVIAYGTYEEIVAPEERKQWMAELLQRLPHLTPVESQMTESEDAVVVFCLRVGRLTGVSEHWR